MNPLNQLSDFGQSIWLDYIRRSLITSGELAGLVRDDNLRGITSNPAIFEKAILGSSDYTEALRDLRAKGMSATEIYEVLAVRDIQDAADVLRPVYDSTQALDGYVSLEVSPRLARDTTATLKDARRLWNEVSRPNLMIKVPATQEGLPAIRQLIGEGINVNVTLIFSPATYEQVAIAYLDGLETAAAQGRDLSRIASVASFFISRVDTAVDALLAGRVQKSAPADVATSAQGLRGKAAIATAKLAYRRYQRLFQGNRWEALLGRGARPQRLLWASTGTKDPSYRDVLYVEELIGPDTVNTLPPATLAAFRDHGRPRASLREDPAGAEATLQRIEAAGVSMTEVSERLLEDGLRLFVDAFDKLIKALETASRTTT